jgi:DNA repair protein RadC
MRSDSTSSDPAASRIREWPATERPRERLRECGPGALSTRELLAILIGSGNAGRSAVTVAAELLHLADGSVRRLSALLERDSVPIAGIGPAVAARLAAALELGRRLAREGPRDRPRVSGARDVFALCSPGLRDLAQEEFHVLLLNTQHGVTRDRLITRGTLDTSIVHAREVFRHAVAENAACVILVHNHPSGDPTPSPEDREVTRDLVRAGDILGIPVLDHVIIGDGRYVSFAEAGLLARHSQRGACPP